MFPDRWVLATVQQVLAPLEDGRLLHQGWSPRCESRPASSDKEWGVLKTTAVQAGEFWPEHNKALPNNLAPRPGIEVKAGDLLITCAGPRARCGIPCLVRKTRPRLMISGKIYRFRVNPNIEPRFLEAYLLSPEVQASIDRLKTGISDSGLNLTHERFFSFPVPVASSSEQRRIITKIDSLSSRSRRAREQLDHIELLVERYKQATLAAAFSGDLTRNWRKTHTDHDSAVAFSNLRNQTHQDERSNRNSRHRGCEQSELRSNKSS